MKPFNLEEAKAGKTVCLRDGTPVRILCFDRHNNLYPIAALIEYLDGDSLVSYSETGSTLREHCHDMYMKTEKKTGWVNIYYQHLKTAPQRECGDVFSSKENAIVHAKGSKHYITTMQIEWEE